MTTTAFNPYTRGVSWNRIHNRILREHARFTSNCPIVSDRREFFEQVRRLIKDPVLYLEFGVWQGASMKYWVEKLSKESKLFGFDSFEGLAENWRPDHPKGTFSTGGKIPDITAPNLEFIPGWFEDTLEPWTNKHRNLLDSLPLLVFIDSDLYAPAMLVLENFKDYWIPGTILMFDEFWDRKHEYKALKDFCRDHNRKYRYVVLSRQTGRVAVEWLP